MYAFVFRSVNQLVFVTEHVAFSVNLQNEFLNIFRMTLRRAKYQSKFTDTLYEEDRWMDSMDLLDVYASKVQIPLWVKLTRRSFWELLTENNFCLVSGIKVRRVGVSVCSGVSYWRRGYKSWMINTGPSISLVKHGFPQISRFTEKYCKLLWVFVTIRIILRMSVTLLHLVLSSRAVSKKVWDR
jgi:hypothetical protein